MVSAGWPHPRSSARACSNRYKRLASRQRGFSALCNEVRRVRTFTNTQGTTAAGDGQAAGRPGSSGRAKAVAPPGGRISRSPTWAESMAARGDCGTERALAAGGMSRPAGTRSQQVTVEAAASRRGSRGRDDVQDSQFTVTSAWSAQPPDAQPRNWQQLSWR